MDHQPNVTQRKPSGFRPLHSFSLRTLFVVVTALGVWLGWNVNVARQRRDALQLFREHGGLIFWKGDVEGPIEANGRTLESTNVPLSREPVSRLVRYVVGDRPVLMIQIANETDQELARRLFPESEVVGGVP